MKHKNPTNIRPFGQSSLPSRFLSKSRCSISPATPLAFSFRFRAHYLFVKMPKRRAYLCICMCVCVRALRGDDVGEAPKPPKRPVSLAEFLDRKLAKTTAKTIKEKQSSFSSIGFGGKASEGKTDDAGVGFILDEATFKRFNCPVKEEADVRMDKDGECDEFQSKFGGTGRVLRKRKSPFCDSLCDSEKDAAPKSLVVLGDDPKPGPKRRGYKSNNERYKPLYNHYANGCGWWDCDREGVDSEEVGHNEVWEGVGSTTVGGLEWH